MPKPGPRERGARESFSLRGGIDVPRLGGINKTEDPGAIGDEQFQELINVRHKGTKLIDKPGLTKIHTTALDGEVRGVFDPILHGGLGGDPELQEVAGISDCSPITGYGTALSRLYWIGTDSCGASDTLFCFAPDQSPQVQKIRVPRGTLGPLIPALDGIHSDAEVLWIHGGHDAIATTTPGRSLRQYKPRSLGSPPDTVLALSHTTASPVNVPFGRSGMAAFFGDFFFASSDVPASSVDAIIDVWKFDGRTVTLEDTTTISAGSWGAYLVAAGMAQYREELIVPMCLGTGTDDEVTDTSVFPSTIRKRTSAGAWSSITLPATVSEFASASNNPVVYKDLCYIFGFGIMPAVHATNSGPIVLSYNGTSLSVAQNAIGVGADSGGSEGIRFPVLFNGFIYYLYTPVNDDTKVYVGRFDGSTWLNTHKDLTAQFAVPHAAYANWLIAYQGKLYVGLNDTAETSRLVASPGTSVTGTWTTVASRANDNNVMFMPTIGFSGSGFIAAVL